MKFRIGPFKYRVGICAGQLVVAGMPCDAATLDGVILLCGTLPPGRRLAPLIHQLRELHVAHYGPMGDDAYATFTADVLRQLRAQGDEPALMRLTSDGWRDAGGVDDLAAEPVGCECGLCGTRYGAHQITTGAPELDAAIGKMVVRRWVDCDFCSRVMTWTEGATAAGSPNGRVVSGPEYYRPAEAKGRRLELDAAGGNG